ncbi:hypothetical protein CLU79DRAFT_221140 [Phycomyces nitens]|nr:hypothetical protein CLU79DRAFT_221140 [Phycomyces nitens]
MHHTKTHHRSAKHTTKSVSHTKKHHHSLTKKITSSVKKHHTKAKKTPTTTKRVIAKSTTSTKKHTTKKHITKKHTTKKHATKKHTTKKHTTKKHTTTKHTTKKHTTITKVAIHTSHTTTRSIPTTSAVPIPVVVPVAKSEDTSNIGSINQNNVESSYNAQNDSADASSANNSDNAENADNADSADSNDSDDSDDSDNSDGSDENDDSDDSGSEDSSEVPAAQPSTTDPNAGNTDTTITSQSVNSAAVDAQHENKTIGISIGAVVGCVAAAGLAGMFITRRRQNARQDSDLEKHERSMGSSSVEGEVNTRWRPQSFMAAVAGAVAKLPKRSPSSSSQNNEGGPGAVRSVFGSIRRAASNASSLRSWGSRRSAGSTASSQHSYGIAVTTPVPQLARVDGGDINQQDVIDGRYNNHNHAY